MTGQGIGIWEDRQDVAAMSHAELVTYMWAQAEANGLAPLSYSDAQHGIPTIYFRGKYVFDRDGEPVRELVGDGYWMPCRRLEG